MPAPRDPSCEVRHEASSAPLFVAAASGTARACRLWQELECLVSDMHADLAKCRDNWTTPLATARLLERFLTGNILTSAHHKFIMATMIGCTTGANRLARPLGGTGALLGHKTGTSDRDTEGRLIALNDAGFVLLPDGRHYVIAVFIKNSRASDAETEAMLAGISACVYRHLAAGRPAGAVSARPASSP